MRQACYARLLRPHKHRYVLECNHVVVHVHGRARHTLVTSKLQLPAFILKRLISQSDILVLLPYCMD
jgi:hypothetical protein